MKNIFADIPSDLTTEVFESLVDSDKVKVERIISKGHSSPQSGWYDQDTNEWVIVLKGEAIILFDDQRSYHLKVGDHLKIKTHQKHKVSWTAADVETIWLAVHY